MYKMEHFPSKFQNYPSDSKIFWEETSPILNFSLPCSFGQASALLEMTSVCTVSSWQWHQDSFYGMLYQNLHSKQI